MLNFRQSLKTSVAAFLIATMGAGVVTPVFAADNDRGRQSREERRAKAENRSENHQARAERRDDNRGAQQQQQQTRRDERRGGERRAVQAGEAPAARQQERRQQAEQRTEQRRQPAARAERRTIQPGEIPAARMTERRDAAQRMEQRRPTENRDRVQVAQRDNDGRGRGDGRRDNNRGGRDNDRRGDNRWDNNRGGDRWDNNRGNRQAQWRGNWRGDRRWDGPRRHVVYHGRPGYYRYYDVPRSRYYNNIRVYRPYGRAYPGFGFYYRDDDALRFLGLTALSLIVFNELNEAQQRAHEAALAEATAADIGERIYWEEDGRSGTVTPVRDGTTEDGRQCREFQQEVTIGGRSTEAYGTACLQPDGSWQVADNE
jgi:hypothetical protein